MHVKFKDTHTKIILPTHRLMCYIYCIMLLNLINLLYPAICQGCHRKLDNPSKHICADCMNKIKLRTPPFCLKCGRQLNIDASHTDTCIDCKLNEPDFDKAMSVCSYNDFLKNLIHDFKYRKITCIAKEFSDIMLNFARAYGLCRNIDVIIPIPMHSKRLLKREINHSEVLAKHFAKKLNIPYSNKTINKTQDTALQTSLKRENRIKNLSGAFKINNQASIKNKNILLVDDLFTTGSTVNECAKALKDKSAKYVEVITLARNDTII